MEKLPVLFISVCSHTKTKNDTLVDYSDQGSIFRYLDKELQRKLHSIRESNLRLLLDGKILRDGDPIIKKPSNSGLTLGPDFICGGANQGKYLPAIKRYAGRFYTQLGGENDRAWLIENSNIHLLIISGLYGVLTPSELIQNYSLHILDSSEVAHNWREDDSLTQLIIKYITQNKIRKIIDVMGDDNYKHLLNWNELRRYVRGNLLHTFSLEYSSPDILFPLGCLLKDMIWNYSYADYQRLRPGKVVDTEYHPVYFDEVQITSKNPNFKEESETKRGLLCNIDRVRRMKANFNRAVHSVLLDKKIFKKTHGLGGSIDLLELNNIVSLTFLQDVRKFLDMRNAIDYEDKQISEKEFHLLCTIYDNSITELTRIHGARFSNLEDVNR
jgi:hypothetical protein